MSDYIEMALKAARGDMEALIFSTRRRVCARRARKLRKRGEDVRFVGFTARGASIYHWVQAPNAELRPLDAAPSRPVAP